MLLVLIYSPLSIQTIVDHSGISRFPTHRPSGMASKYSWGTIPRYVYLQLFSYILLIAFLLSVEEIYLISISSSSQIPTYWLIYHSIFLRFSQMDSKPISPNVNRKVHRPTNGKRAATRSALTFQTGYGKIHLLNQPRRPGGANYKEWRCASWRESRLWRPGTCARAPRTAAAASARLPASPPARPAAAWPIRSARTPASKRLPKSAAVGGAFSVRRTLWYINIS